MPSAPFRSFAVSLALFAAPAALAAPACEDRGKDYQARIALCNSAYARAANPDDAATALGYKAEAQRMLGRLDEAAATLRAALRLAPQNPWYWVELGHVRFDDGDPAGAVAHYSTAIELDPQDLYARLNRAEGWWRLNAPDRCLADSGRAVEASPGDAWANLVQGRCLTGLGRAEEALAHLDRALAADPAWAAAQGARVSALLALGRAEEALAAADEGLAAVSPDDPSARQELRILRLQAMARSRPIEATLAEAAALAADHPDSLAIPAVKVLVLTRAGRLDEAAAEAAPLRAAETAGEPMQGSFHDALAQLDLAQGDMGGATRHFTLAMALDPALARIYTRGLSTLGFLPLSSARHNVALALQRCLEAMGTECRIGG